MTDIFKYNLGSLRVSGPVNVTVEYKETICEKNLRTVLQGFVVANDNRQQTK